MNMKAQINKWLRPAWAVMGTLVALSACTDDWDDHYELDSQSATQNIMEILESNPDLSSFCQVVKQQHLDTLLTADQTFTVWAPNNAAMANFVDDGNVTEHFLQNHINRYLYNVADLTDTAQVRVKMLNGKYQNYRRNGSGFTFASAELTNEDYAATNGMVHTLSGTVPFYLNIYESICQDNNGTDSVADYIKSFDVYTFDKNNSTSIGKNNLGQLVYDSVFVYTNEWMNNYGDLYKEDSLYTMQVPSNTCWQQAYEQWAPYFRTFGQVLTSSVTPSTNVPTRTYELNTALSDSLTRAYTIQNMVANLVFRGQVDPYNAPGDSLVATSGNVFHSPAALFAGSSSETVSNGEIWHASTWNYQPEDCFLKEIVVEAENTRNRTDAYANVFSRSASSTIYSDSVSEQKFIEVSAATTSARTQPTVQFTIPNTLAATYDVYVVFAPAMAYAADAEPDSTRVRFFLNYVHEDGKMHEDAAINGSVTLGNSMTNMYVGRITLPYANYSESPFEGPEDQDDDCVRLRVQTDVKSSETAKLSRTMRIDCIKFEPVTE
jgi:hypothetical protein